MSYAQTTDPHQLRRVSAPTVELQAPEWRHQQGAAEIQQSRLWRPKYPLFRSKAHDTDLAPVWML